MMMSLLHSHKAEFLVLLSHPKYSGQNFSRLLVTQQFLVIMRTLSGQRASILDFWYLSCHLEGDDVNLCKRSPGGSVDWFGFGSGMRIESIDDARHLM